jgi:hypothetical protein
MTGKNERYVEIEKQTKNKRGRIIGKVGINIFVFSMKYI